MAALFKCFNRPSGCGGVLINNVPPFCQYLTNKVESSIYLYDTYDLEIVDIIKDFENGKASEIPTILI